MWWSGLSVQAQREIHFPIQLGGWWLSVTLENHHLFVEIKTKSKCMLLCVGSDPLTLRGRGQGLLPVLHLHPYKGAQIKNKIVSTSFLHNLGTLLKSRTVQVRGNSSECPALIVHAGKRDSGPLRLMECSPSNRSNWTPHGPRSKQASPEQVDASWLFPRP